MSHDSIDSMYQAAVSAYLAGRASEAAALFRRLIELSPRSPEYHNALGTVLARQGSLDEARRCFALAVDLAPTYAPAFYNLGNVLAAERSYDEAIAAYRRSVALDPASAATFNNLGSAYLTTHQPDQAIDAYRQALAHRPDLAPATLSLGSLLRDTGQLDAAITCYRQSLAVRHNPQIASALLYLMLFHPAYTSGQLLEEHLRWNETYARPLAPPSPHHPNDPSPHRRLRIGYVSSDFRNHVIGYNLLPLIAEHDRAPFEIVCYSNVAAPDSMTDRFRLLADQWRDIRPLNNQQSADLIQTDQIDVLVDTSLHMADHRLLVFARKPAPIQVTFAAYPGTTGLKAMDCRLTDRFLDPPGQSDNGRYSERSIRLANSFWCFDPQDTEPAVAVPPSARNGFITFGCLNAFAKITEPSLKLWARVLAAVKDSRLLILAPSGSARNRLTSFLNSLDIAPDRITFANRQPRRKYLELYHQVDIFLDTFPYNGHSTALDALWMGVPVVTLAGEQVVSRAGLSILSNVGLERFVAHDSDAYVGIANELAAAKHELATLRTTMRDRMRSSPLMNAPGFARDVESAFREMWIAWCQAPSRS